MLVEDDDAVRMFGARACENKGATTSPKPGAARLPQVWLTHAGRPPDLLITDVVTAPDGRSDFDFGEVRDIDPVSKG